ncbi:MAG TPA: histidine kinase, partial [Actinomycetes bacterium]|nr:histidine kinase [Actinomycetes bacterium]
MVVEPIEGGAGRRLVALLWWSVCALSLLLIALTIGFHLTTRYDWWFGGTFNPWRMFTVEAIAALGAPILGGLIVWRQPFNRYGWIWCLLGLGMTVRGAAYAYEIWALYVAPYQPGGLEAAWVGNLMDALNWGLVPLLLLLFPDGRPPSPRWRPVVWAAVAVYAVWAASTAVAPGPMDDGTPNPIRWLHGSPGEVARTVALGLWRPTLLLMAIGALSLLARYRHTDGRQRQQIKWLAYAAVPLALSFLVQLRWDLIGLLGAVVTAATSWAIYIAIGIAVLRHHLYDIDRLINRTVVYGLLTAGGVAVYVAVVKLAEWLLREGVGLGGSLVATAVIAVGFAPARDRLQRWVDRRLYGERHDPVQAMVRLGERLRDAPRGTPDGDVLVGVLQAVCEALRLPSASLRVAGVEVASFGEPAAASEPIPLEHEGQQVGVLLVGLRAGERAFGLADRRVLEVLAAPVAVTLHAVLLSQELQRSRERLVAAREEERRRLRRDLHDGLGPILTAVTLKADAARSALDTAPDRADALLAELRGDAKQAIGDLRLVVYNLRPAALDELGLLGALGEQVDRFSRQGLSIRLNTPAALPVLPAAVEVATYRIITEALTNVVRHAQAHRVAITVAIDGDLCLEVHDDGAGSTANGDGWRPGLGLQSMVERAAGRGGAGLEGAATGSAAVREAALHRPDVVV